MSVEMDHDGIVIFNRNDIREYFVAGLRWN